MNPVSFRGRRRSNGAFTAESNSEEEQPWHCSVATNLIR